MAGYFSPFRWSSIIRLSYFEITVCEWARDAYDEALKAYNLYAVDPDAEYLQKASMAMRKAQNLMLNSIFLEIVNN